MSALQILELMAGTGPDGLPVVERVQARAIEDGSFQLVKSPAFIKGLASGDTVRLQGGKHEFSVVKRSGNLCIRVFCRGDIAALNENLTPALEKLGAELDTENPRLLVYSIHVSCGFNAIENILNQHVGEQSSSMWLYGNVYDPKDGQTPLNWWQNILIEN